MESIPRLLIVDGHAYAYRSFYAIRSLTSPNGAPVNAIFGFIKTVTRMQNQLKPSHLVVVWDGGLAAERMALLPGYKAQRPPMPVSLEEQLDGLVAWVQAAGWVSLMREGVEADDWIATLAQQGAAAGAEVIIASSDKDFMQLVRPGIGLLNPNDKSEAIWSADEVRAKAGVNPDQIVDYLSMVGDSVDNIPGVPGVGPKTAARLLQQFGSWENLLARRGEVDSDRLRTALWDAAETVKRNQRLIRLRTDIAGELGLEDLAPRRAENARLRELYECWGFQSMLKQIAVLEAPQAELF